MFPLIIRCGIFAIASLMLMLQQGCASPKDVVRPEKIRSMREVYYDKETYQELAGLWEKYNRVYPSEDAYANWMYAFRYANRGDNEGEAAYEKKLLKGLEKYPANPTLLYLASMLSHGKHDDHVATHRLERAAELDPSYLDPWFNLVIQHMDQRNEDKLTHALRKLFEGGAINDMVMDYNYNMLAALDPNAILITNGDNDTYPGWVLQRIVGFRQDVDIVNRSLLNTEWYPLYLLEQGFPPYTTESGLSELREGIKEAGKSDPSIFRQPGGPFGDTLIVKIIEAAKREGRPVYLASTVYLSGVTKRLFERGAQLGLATRVSPEGAASEADIERLKQVWLTHYRTAGLDSWRTRYSAKGDASRPLAANYAYGPIMLMEAMEDEAPIEITGLLVWLTDHVSPVMTKEKFDQVFRSWCAECEREEVKQWCRNNGYLE